MTKPQRYGTSSAPRDDGIYVLFSEYERVVAALRAIAAIENKMVGGDWEEIEEARAIAVRALGETA
jgi:hypothetical protein